MLAHQQQAAIPQTDAELLRGGCFTGSSRAECLILRTQGRCSRRQIRKNGEQSNAGAPACSSAGEYYCEVVCPDLLDYVGAVDQKLPS